MNHELVHHPVSLFTDEGYLIDSKKADLTKFIFNEYQFDDVIPNIRNWKKVLHCGL